MIGIKVDAKKALKDLKLMKASALPYAMLNALNRSAFHARAEWKAEVKGAFTLRNAFTERSLLVERATGKNVSTMRATVGSTAPYMDEQEYGATIQGKSKHKPIPGPVAAGLPPGGKRTKLVRAGNKLSALHVSRPVGANPRQRRAVAIAMAFRRGSRVVLLDRPNGGKGLFRLVGGRKKAQTRLLWDLSRGSVRVNPTPTLQNTLGRIQARVAEIHHEAVLQQLRRHKILGY